MQQQRERRKGEGNRRDKKIEKWRREAARQLGKGNRGIESRRKDTKMQRGRGRGDRRGKGKKKGGVRTWFQIQVQCT